MRLTAATEAFIADLRAEGRISSPHTELSYRTKLNALADETGNRDPKLIGREDLKRVLRRWSHPNSQRQAHAVYSSFFKWCLVEGLRDTNPADQVRRARHRQPDTYRMTLEEVQRFWRATEGHRRDRWVAALGLGSGLRNQEIRLLRGEHLARAGWVWVSQDIGKGHKARWIPVLDEFAPTIDEMVALTPHDRLVLPGRRWADPNEGVQRDADVPMCAQSLRKQVKRIAARAGLPADRISTHSMRHAYGDHAAKQAGLRVAQALMGHASVETTAREYTDRVSLDELSANVVGFRFGLTRETREVERDG